MLSAHRANHSAYSLNPFFGRYKTTQKLSGTTFFRKAKQNCQPVPEEFRNLDKVSQIIHRSHRKDFLCLEIAARLAAAALSNDILPDICVSSSASASDAQTRWQGCHSDRRRQGNRLWGSPPHGQTWGTCYHRYSMKKHHITSDTVRDRIDWNW